METRTREKFICKTLEMHRIIFTFVRVDGPRFRFIKMSIASVNGKVSVSQRSTRSVKGVTISVFS